MSDLTTLSACELQALLTSGELTAVKLMQACLDRIAEREGEVQAFAYLDPAKAIAAAKESDDARRSGMGVGPLHGLPVAVKDIIDTEDQPTEHGCAFYAGNQPRRDAAVVRRLREAGAIIIGKTVTTELATLTPPKTRNPRNLEHTPGGSSSGSAAAVAAGMVPLALGTQTGGSVIRPASFCGIHGFKPTRGLIPRGGVMLQSATLDTVGVYGRSVEDLALIAEAIGLQEPDEPTSYPRSQGRMLAVASSEPPIAPLFAFVRTPIWESEASDVTRAAFEELIEALGDRVTSTDMPSLEAAIAAHRIVNAAENSHHYGHLLKEPEGAITPGLRARLEAGQKISAVEYLDALNRREDLYEHVEAICINYTAILTLAAPGIAPKGYGSTGNPIFNGMWTFLGAPAVTLPLLEADGMPIGVQLIGRRRDDARLLRTARWLEKHVQTLA